MFVMNQFSHLLVECFNFLRKINLFRFSALNRGLSPITRGKIEVRAHFLLIIEKLVTAADFWADFLNHFRFGNNRPVVCW